MPQTERKQQSTNRPEKKFGPYPGGIGVAVWLNTIETQNGPRKVRSVTVSPRRYRDAESGEWRDASSYRVGDLPALLFAIEQAQAFCIATPIPGQDEEAGTAGESIPY